MVLYLNIQVSKDRMVYFNYGFLNLRLAVMQVFFFIRKIWREHPTPLYYFCSMATNVYTRNFNNVETMLIDGDIVRPEDMQWCDWNDVPAISQQDLKRFLENAGGKDVCLMINSGGGDLGVAENMAALLKNYSGSVTTVGMGLVASAAVTLFLAGDQRALYQGCKMMIHNLTIGMQGKTIEQARATLDGAQKMEDDIVKQYAAIAAATNKTDEDLTDLFKNMMNKETWLTSEEAVALGFASEIVPYNAPLPTTAPSVESYANTPASIRNHYSTNNKLNMSLFDQIKARFSNTATPAAEPVVPVATPVAEPIAVAPEISVEDALKVLEKSGYESVKKEELQDLQAKIEAQEADFKNQLDQLRTPPTPSGVNPPTPATVQNTVHSATVRQIGQKFNLDDDTISQLEAVNKLFNKQN